MAILFRADNTPKISGIDWITMASLRSSSNTLLAYQSPDDELSAITTPNELIGWFTKAGFTLLERLVTDSNRNFSTLNIYARSPNNYFIVSLIDSQILSRGRGLSVPNHWVVWSSQIKDSRGKLIDLNTKATDTVNLSVFSWGNRYLKINPITRRTFEAKHYLALVFKK